MIPRRLRLSRREFESVTSGASLLRAQSPHFAISYGPAPLKGGCGAVVAKKVEKSAVKRHMLKRRIKAVIAPLCPPKQVLIVYARAGSSTLPFSELEAELRALIERTRA